MSLWVKNSILCVCNGKYEKNLQKVTEEALKKNIKDIANGSYGQKYNAKAGAAVVMDVKSGEILALAI